MSANGVSSVSTSRGKREREEKVPVACNFKGLKAVTMKLKLCFFGVHQKILDPSSRISMFVRVNKSGKKTKQQQQQFTKHG